MLGRHMRVTIELSTELLAWITENARHEGRPRKTEIEHMLRGCMAKGLSASQLPFPRKTTVEHIQEKVEVTPEPITFSGSKSKYTRAVEEQKLAAAKQTLNTK